MRLFQRAPVTDALTFAEAQALVDDGLDPELVLEIYPEDREWLRPLLQTSAVISAAAAADQPSFYFDATLKAKFLAAAADLQAGVPATLPVIAPAPSGAFFRLRTFAAGAAVLAAAGLMSIVTLGLVTADKSVPGDWNYVFKRSNERVEYTLSPSNAKVDVQLKTVDSRVAEIQEVLRDSNRTVSSADLERLQRDANDLAQLAGRTQLDTSQKARLQDIGEKSVAVLSDVKQKQAELQPAANTTIDAVNNAVAAGGATVKPVETGASPSPSATATASPSATATPSPTATPGESDTSSPATTPSPAGTPTAPPSTTPTPKP